MYEFIALPQKTNLSPQKKETSTPKVGARMDAAGGSGCTS